MNLIFLILYELVAAAKFMPHWTWSLTFIWIVHK